MVQRPTEIPSDLDAPQSGRSFLRPYVVAWAVMACAAACYLYAILVRPPFLEGYLPPSQSPAAEAVAQTVTEIAAINEKVGGLQSDMSKTQADLAAHTQQDQELAGRVTALEQRFVIPPEAAAQTHEQPTTRHAETQAEPAGRAGQAKVLNAPIETGSVGEGDAGPAAAPAAAPAKPKQEKSAVGTFSTPRVTKPVGVKLATGSTVDNLRVSWGILTERHPEELKALTPRYHSGVDGNGIVYDLVAGPFKSLAEAKKVCKTLQAQAISCQVSDYGGNSL